MTKSEEFFKMSLNKMPGGVNSPVRAFNAVKKPRFLLKGRKVHISMMLMAINTLIMYVLGALVFWVMLTQEWLKP